MKLEEIIQLRPQCASIESGAEPSLRSLIEDYYAPHFPENYTLYADDYLEKLQELIDKTEAEAAIHMGDMVRVVFDAHEGTPESFTNELIEIGHVGIVSAIVDEEFPINVLFNDGRNIAFKVEELRKV